MPPPPPAAPRKSTPVWVWILAAIGGVIALGLIAVVVVTMFVAQKVTEFASNPKEIARLITAANPDLEFQDFDKDKKTVRVKVKSTGEEMTFNWDDVQQGKIAITKRDDKGEEQRVEIGQGGKANLPHFVPKYPGVEIQSVMSATGGADGSGGVANFQTKDSPDKVYDYYAAELKKSGLTLKSEVKAGDTRMITAQSEDEKDNVVVQITGLDGGSNVQLMYGSKKP